MGRTIRVNVSKGRDGGGGFRGGGGGGFRGGRGGGGDRSVACIVLIC